MTSRGGGCPGYIVVQLAGATLAALFLQAVIDVSATYGSNYPAAGYSSMAAFWMEFILTLGLVSVILGTASGAQNIGIVGAFGVGALHRAGRAVGQPDLGHVDEPGPHVRARPRRRDWTAYWVYVAGPIAGAVAAVVVGVRAARPGGGRAGSGAAQGALYTEVADSETTSDAHLVATSGRSQCALDPTGRRHGSLRASHRAARRTAPIEHGDARASSTGTRGRRAG